jgi:transposase
LEKERFHWPRSSPEPVVTINGQELNWLLDGYDIARMKPHKTLRYASVL